MVEYCVHISHTLLSFMLLEQNLFLEHIPVLLLKCFGIEGPQGKETVSSCRYFFLLHLICDYKDR